MARVVIVGCGCRGLELARLLRGDGHAVRGVTRREERRGELESAGVDVWIGDPDRIASISYSMENATVLCWLLASAEGEAEAVEALHGTRLEMMLERTIDTTVRGVLYEARGNLPDELVKTGARNVERICGRNQIPWTLLEEDPGDWFGWASAAKAAVDSLLQRERG